MFDDLRETIAAYMARDPAAKPAGGVFPLSRPEGHAQPPLRALVLSMT